MTSPGEFGPRDNFVSPERLAAIDDEWAMFNRGLELDAQLAEVDVNESEDERFERLKMEVEAEIFTELRQRDEGLDRVTDPSREINGQLHDAFMAKWTPIIAEKLLASSEGKPLYGTSAFNPTVDLMTTRLMLKAYEFQRIVLMRLHHMKFEEKIGYAGKDWLSEVKKTYQAEMIRLYGYHENEPWYQLFAELAPGVSLDLSHEDGPDYAYLQAADEKLPFIQQATAFDEQVLSEAKSLAGVDRISDDEEAIKSVQSLVLLQALARGLFENDADTLEHATKQVTETALRGGFNPEIAEALAEYYAEQYTSPY